MASSTHPHRHWSVDIHRKSVQRRLRQWIVALVALLAMIIAGSLQAV